MESRKELIQKIRNSKKDRCSYFQSEVARREANLEKVAEIKYGEIPELLKKIKKQNKN